MTLDGFEPDNWQDLPKTGAYGGFVGMWRYPDEARNEFFRAAARWSSAELASFYTAIFGWQLPDGYGPDGPSGFLQVSHGNYQGTTPTAPLTPRALSQITTLRYTIKHQVASVRQLSLYNGMWLTDVPCASGALSGVKAEVSAFPSCCQETRTWAEGITQVGTYTDPDTGQVWKAATNDEVAPYITFRPHGVDDVYGAQNWKDRLDWLVAQGAVNNTWNFNGMGFGPEPFGGDGAALVGLRCDSYT